MAKKADSDELRQAFQHHLKETEGQVQRLEQVFALCELKPSGKTCHAIKGILEEGEEDMKDAKDPDVLDAGMIADAQAVEHYEIARYGTMIAWAKQLGMNDAARPAAADARAGIQRRPNCLPSSPRRASTARPLSARNDLETAQGRSSAGHSPALWLFAPEPLQALAAPLRLRPFRR